MRRRLCVTAASALVLIVALFAMQPALVGQARAPKRPLSYDVVDYWRSVAGTRLSSDGQWLAYALTSQAEDGEIVVRNMKSGQEFRHPPGTSPQFTEDGRFCVFTISQSKAEEEKERLQNQAQAAAGQEAALRRLGKEAYMFNYNGELHGLRNRDNMKHWTVHMDEFFDH
ncbi:MAG: hypothetical protein ACM3NQ_14050, partial [Bacteroidales bacterium]